MDPGVPADLSAAIRAVASAPLRGARSPVAFRGRSPGRDALATPRMSPAWPRARCLLALRTASVFAPVSSTPSLPHSSPATPSFWTLCLPPDGLALDAAHRARRTFEGGGGLRGAAIRTGPDPAREIRKASGCFVSAGRRNVGRTALAPASAPRTATPRMPSAGVVSRCVKRPAARPAVPARSSCAGRQGTAEKIRARARVCGEFMGRAGRTDRRRPPRRIDSSCAG